MVVKHVPLLTTPYRSVCNLVVCHPFAHGEAGGPLLLPARELSLEMQIRSVGICELEAAGGCPFTIHVQQRW